MRHHDGGEIRTVLSEGNPVLRAGIRAVLHDRGVRELVVSKDPRRLADALDAELADLFICDADIPGLDICELVQMVRQQMLGQNPFLAVVATASDSSFANVRRLINAGIDGVLRKPMSIADVVHQMSLLTGTRRPFVATGSYVGPTRRSAPRADDDGAILVTVPNTLDSRVRRQADDRRLRHLVAAASCRVAALRVQSTPRAIARGIRRALAFYDGRGTVDSLRLTLRRIAFLARDMARHQRAGQAEHLAVLAEGLFGLVVKIAEDLSTPCRHHLDLLDQLGQVFEQIGRAPEANVPTVWRIAEALDDFSRKAALSTALPLSLGPPAL